MIRSHTFNGKRFKVYNLAGLPAGDLGACGDRYIKVPIDGDTLEELDAIIHEGLHAATPLNEESVCIAAMDVAKLLWRLGWRKHDLET